MFFTNSKRRLRHNDMGILPYTAAGAFINMSAPYPVFLALINLFSGM